MSERKSARPARDAEEERRVRKLATSRMAPRGLGQRAQMVVLSWEGNSVDVIAGEVRVRPRTVRAWLDRFNAAGVAGLADRPRSGRPHRFSQSQREWLVGVARTGDHGRPWTLTGLTDLAARGGVEVSRSQLRRILIDAGVSWWEQRAGADGKGAN